MINWEVFFIDVYVNKFIGSIVDRFVLVGSVVIYVDVYVIWVIVINNVKVNGKVLINIEDIGVYCIWISCFSIWVGSGVINGKMCIC